MEIIMSYDEWVTLDGSLFEKSGQKLADAVRQCQASEKAVTHLEMELAKTKKEAASEDELNRLEDLKKIISAEEKEIDRLIQGSKEFKEKASELQSKTENAGGESLKKQKSKVTKFQSDIDKNGTEINRHKVQVETGQKMIKKLTKEIEEYKKEKERVIEEKDKMRGVFKEMEEKAYQIQ
ncbi:hypothetical protein HS088_TW11G00560 [Tripterygium wilfordii]|uniref:Uncharacterized protein n=1 Tax=Tripterygium wilfordii TaxID=458696 RepID=A0A7J7D2C9_TRIWF|nr:hypothetical protein HS088_TW11G00560 [Tripterygium wilfordii]